MKLTGVAGRVVSYYFSGSVADGAEYVGTQNAIFSLKTRTQTVKMKLWDAVGGWEAMQAILVQPNNVGMLFTFSTDLYTKIQNDSGVAATIITMVGWRWS